jgi:hypothetical protein
MFPRQPGSTPSRIQMKAKILSILPRNKKKSNQQPPIDDFCLPRRTIRRSLRRDSLLIFIRIQYENMKSPHCEALF